MYISDFTPTTSKTFSRKERREAQKFKCLVSPQAHNQFSHLPGEVHPASASIAYLGKRN